MHVYVAGPMRGYEQFNFPAFERATAYLRHLGYEVTSPAEMDLEMGLDPTIANTDAEHDFDVEDALRRDFEVILKADGIVLIEGWENSSGARAERWVAETTGKKVYLLRPYGGSYMLRKTTAADWNGDPRKPNPDDAFEAVILGYTNITPEGVARTGTHAEHWDEPRSSHLDIEHQKALTNGRKTGAVIEAEARNQYAALGQDGTGQLAAALVDVKGALDGENPKDRLGVAKPQLHLNPASALLYMAGVMGLGAAKYGAYNWREKAVKRTVYYSAAMRHITAALDGQDLDPESGLPHEAHAMACMAIILDALATGNLVDDRPPAGAAAGLIADMTQQ